MKFKIICQRLFCYFWEVLENTFYISEYLIVRFISCLVQLQNQPNTNWLKPDGVIFHITCLCLAHIHVHIHCTCLMWVQYITDLIRH